MRRSPREMSDDRGDRDRLNMNGRRPIMTTRVIRSLAYLSLVLVPGDRIAPFPSQEAGLAPVCEADEETPGADGLTDRRRRGKKIYVEGTSESGDAITASLGPSRDGVSAAFLACANCHGRDGRGRAEGGIEPPDLTWRSLVLARVDQGQARRGRPPYTPRCSGGLSRWASTRRANAWVSVCPAINFRAATSMTSLAILRSSGPTRTGESLPERFLSAHSCRQPEQRVRDARDHYRDAPGGHRRFE